MSNPLTIRGAILNRLPTAELFRADNIEKMRSAATKEGRPFSLTDSGDKYWVLVKKSDPLFFLEGDSNCPESYRNLAEYIDLTTVNDILQNPTEAAPKAPEKPVRNLEARAKLAKSEEQKDKLAEIVKDSAISKASIKYAREVQLEQLRSVILKFQTNK